MPEYLFECARCGAEKRQVSEPTLKYYKGASLQCCKECAEMIVANEKAERAKAAAKRKKAEAKAK